MNLPAMQEPQEIPWSLGWEDPLEEGMATPLKYSCLENPMDRGVWWAAAQGVTKSQTQLKWLSNTVIKIYKQDKHVKQNI